MIPGYGRLARQFGIEVSKKHKKSFLKNSLALINSIPSNEKVNVNVCAFSGEKGFADQLFCILSFYYNVGTPRSWTIYSDETITPEQISVFERIPNLKVLPWNTYPFTEQSSKLIEFSKYNVWGKRMIAYMNQPVEQPTILTDSDIIFYKGFRSSLLTLTKGNWYIQDTMPHVDQYYKDQKFPFHRPVLNAGFLLLNQYPQWNFAIDYITNRADHSTWEHFTEQAAVNWMFQNEPIADTLDPAKYILSCSDSFKFGFNYDYNAIAMRHFVGPVRHKMWQYHWKKVLGITS